MSAGLGVILLVEDDGNDALLATRALRNSGALQRVIHVSDGEQAIKFMSGAPPYTDRAAYPLPNLVLLDLKMPKLTGFDVLEWLQDRPELASRIPVIVLTGSVYDEDRRKAKELGAVGYQIKPLGFSELVDFAKNLSGTGSREAE